MTWVPGQDVVLMWLATLWISLAAASGPCPQSCRCWETFFGDGRPGLDIHCLGPLPQPLVLADLPHGVHRLNMTGCSLKSFQQPAWPQLQWLQVLDLSVNQIPRSLMQISEIAPNLLSLNVSKNGLDSLAFSIPKSLKVLLANHNALPSLNCDHFMNIPELEAIYLDFNMIQNVTCSGRKKLPKLRTLSLSHNAMSSLGNEFSVCFDNAEYLTLAGNKIRHISSEMFQSFMNLQYLDLTDNEIDSVENKAFQNLRRLRYLSLSGNRLMQPPVSLPLLEWLDLSYNLIPTLSESQTRALYLHEVFLIGGNPLHCNCSLVSLKELYDTREYQINFLSVNRSKFVPVCDSPAPLAGDSWDVLGDEVFVCDSVKPDPQLPLEPYAGLNDRGDRSMRAVDITASSITLKWMVQADSAMSIEEQLVYIQIHPFGKKSLLQTHSVLWRRGVYIFKNLSPASSYVVCMDMSSAATDLSASHHSSDCLELVTKPDDSFTGLGSVQVLYFVITGIIVAVTSVVLLSRQF